ncbi:transmembrane protein 92 [Rhinatrema bivittatum]|uniref:transmembrane protein 92 n=1 Tax=Rhinatrema bivittatum TaxID=194408 RepID=UPI00112ED73C|nr:transmembrane protein 92 [Rhinatrema bivittatum]
MLPFPRPGQALGTELLVICLGSLPQTAAVRCGISECLSDSYCCGGQCCSQSKIYLDNSWYGPLFISMMVAFSFICLCGLCNRLCKSSAPAPAESNMQARPASFPTLDPRIPATMAAPQQARSEEPPPYNEVTSKPFLYPVPVGQPPSYSSVVAEDPLSREIHVQVAL